MLLNILQCTDHPLATKNDLAPNASSSKVEMSGSGTLEPGLLEKVVCLVLPPLLELALHDND